MQPDPHKRKLALLTWYAATEECSLSIQPRVDLHAWPTITIGIGDSPCMGDARVKNHVKLEIFFNFSGKYHKNLAILLIFFRQGSCKICAFC